MQDFLKSKLVTSLIVIATVILAGVAIFTAIRLYQLRNESVSPTDPEESMAWDCSNYQFDIDISGRVEVTNNSSRNEPPQQAKIYIDNQLVATFDVPALTEGDSAILGNVGLPIGSFDWRIVGTIDCINAGSAGQEPVACTSLAFNLPGPSSTPTNTPTSTATPTATGSPTNTPTGTITITPTGTVTTTPTGTVTPTQPPGETSTPTSTATLTPTSGGIAAASPTPGGAALPDAGIPTPTIIAGLAGILLILFALLLAL